MKENILAALLILTVILIKLFTQEDKVTHICMNNDLEDCDGECCSYCIEKAKCNYKCQGACDKCIEHIKIINYRR